MSEPDAVPLPRAGEVFFDVRGEARTMRLSWYADSAVAVFSIWQGNRCTGTFRLPFADLDRMIATLHAGPPGQAGVGRDADLPGYLDESGAYGPGDGYLADEYGQHGYAAGYGEAEPDAAGYDAADYVGAGYGPSGYPSQWPGEVGSGGYAPGDYLPGAYGSADYAGADYGTAEYVGAGYDGVGYGGADYAPAGEYAGADYAVAEHAPGEYGPGEYGPGEYPEYVAGDYGAGDYGAGDYVADDYVAGAYGAADDATDGAGYQPAAEYWAGGYDQPGPARQPGLPGPTRPALAPAGRYGDVEPIGRLDQGRAGAGRHRGADLPGASGPEPFGAESPAAQGRAGAEEAAGGSDLPGLPSVPAGKTSAGR
ncbi:MAG: hypothetical protein ACYCVZ_05305 [Streptosporangiaceae bacterium]